MTVINNLIAEAVFEIYSLFNIGSKSFDTSLIFLTSLISKISIIISNSFLISFSPFLRNGLRHFINKLLSILLILFSLKRYLKFLNSFFTNSNNSLSLLFAYVL